MGSAKGFVEGVGRDVHRRTNRSRHRTGERAGRLACAVLWFEGSGRERFNSLRASPEARAIARLLASRLRYANLTVMRFDHALRGSPDQAWSG